MRAIVLKKTLLRLHVLPRRYRSQLQMLLSFSVALFNKLATYANLDLSVAVARTSVPTLPCASELAAARAKSYGKVILCRSYASNKPKRMRKVNHTHMHSHESLTVSACIGGLQAEPGQNRDTAHVLCQLRQGSLVSFLLVRIW